MAKDDLEFRIVATDDATKVVDKVQTKVDKLEGSEADVQLTATDKATDRIDEVFRRVDGLDKETATVILNAEESKAESEIRKLQKLLADVDGEEATAVIAARDAASDRLDKVQAKMREVEARSPVDVDVETGPGFGKLTGLLDKLPGQLGEIAGAAGTGAIGVGAIATALFQAATNAAEFAIEAKNVATFIGSSVEEASKLLIVLDTVGVESGDLMDIIGQVNQVLAQTPGLAEDLGVAMKDASPADVFLDAYDAIRKIEDPQKRLLLMNQAFGEQGARQVAAVVSQYGDLRGAMLEVDDARVVTDEDAEDAKRYKEAVRQLTAEFSEFAAELGEGVLPFLTQIVELLNKLDLAKPDLTFASSIPEGQEDALDFLERNKQLIEDLGLNYRRLKADAAFGESGVAELQAEIDRAGEKAKKTGSQIGETERETRKLGDTSRKTAPEVADVARDTEHMGIAAQDAANPVRSLTTAVEEHTVAYQKLKGEYRVEDAFRSAKKAFDDLTTSIHETGKMSEQTEASFARAREATIDYIETVEELPPDVKTRLQVAVDQGSADHARAVLDALTVGRTADIMVDIHPQGSGRFKVVPAAEGSPGLPGGMTLVGEHGPELIRLPQSTMVFTAADTRAMLTGSRSADSGSIVSQTTIVNVPRGYRELDASSAAHRVVRRSGRLYTGRAV